MKQRQDIFRIHLDFLCANKDVNILKDTRRRICKSVYLLFHVLYLKFNNMKLFVITLCVININHFYLLLSTEYLSCIVYIILFHS